MIYITHTIILTYNNLVRNCTFYDTCVLCYDTYTGVNCSLLLHTGTNCRSFRQHQRNGLTLHVGSHQCTVCVVVLQERNQSRSYREHHLRRYIHVVKHGLIISLGLIKITSGYVVSYEISVLIQRLICLCYMVIVLFISGHVDNFVGDTRILRI